MVINKRDILNEKDIFFLLGYGTYLFFMILSSSFYYIYFMGVLFNSIVWFSIFCLIGHELFIHKVTVKGIILLILIAIAIITSALVEPNILYNKIIHLLFFIYIGRNVKFNRIAIVSIWITTIAVMFVILSSKVGIIENHENIFLDGRVRQYLGFRYTLYAPAYVFNITALVIYMKKNKIKWFQLILLMISNVYIYRMTYSRLSFYFSMLLILIAMLMKIFPNILKEKKLVHFGMSMSFVICTIISVNTTIIYRSDITWLYELNDFLERRISTGQLAFLRYGISLFGKDIEWIGNALDVYGKIHSGSYFYVDNFYLQILINYGIIFTVILILLLTLAFIKAWRSENYYLEVVLLFVALHGFVDDLIMNIHYNTFWFAIVPLILGNMNVSRDKIRKRNQLNKRLQFEGKKSLLS